MEGVHRDYPRGEGGEEWLRSKTEMMMRRKMSCCRLSLLAVTIEQHWTESEGQSRLRAYSM